MSRWGIAAAVLMALGGAGCWWGGRPTVPDFATQYGGSNQVVLINATSIPICYVYLWPTVEQTIGSDWLAENETVAPGTRRDFGVQPGTYGFRLDACDGSVLQFQGTADLNGPREIFISDGSVPVYAPAAGLQRLEFGVMSAPPPSGYGTTSAGGYGTTSSGYGTTSSGYGTTSAGGYGTTSSGSGSTSSGGTPSGSGSDYYSLTLHNSCPDTVDLYIGDGEPPFGSGTYTNIGSNTTQSQSGTLPESIWIIDDSQRPLSSFSPRAGSQSIEILESCSGFAPY